jgi:hypothetical protein
MEFIGIDVHKRDSQVCILDERVSAYLSLASSSGPPHRGRPCSRIFPCAGGTVRPKSSANRRLKKPRGEGLGVRWHEGGDCRA